MTTSSRQDEMFIHAVINPCLLEEAIEWIKDNMQPEDVFPGSDLEHWAETNGYILDI